MKKIDFGQTLSILANVGVIAGIAILAVEIQQNTRSLEFNAYQALISQINTQTQINITEADISDRLNYLVNLPAEALAVEEFSGRDRLYVANYFFLLTRHADLAYYQYELGMLPEERLESAIGPLRARWCSAVYGNWWYERSFNFVSTFRDYVTSQLQEC